MQVLLPPSSSRSLLPAYLVTAPEKGEDFQVIADDFQKLILPGESKFFLHKGHHMRYAI